ncbi:MAG: hypothetical protein ACRDHV_11660 [Actinomycetota bacterium]
MLRAAVYAWALPNTLLGLLCGALSFQRYRRIDGVMVFDGQVKGFLAILRGFHRSAITFGHVVLADRPVDGWLQAHELHHVWQYEVATRSSWRRSTPRGRPARRAVRP